MAIQQIENLQLGKFLQIAFSEGIRSQMSEDFRDWEMVKRAKSGSVNGREVRFMFKTALGAAAVQYRNPSHTGSAGSAFPVAQQSTLSEHIAFFKELNATIELEQNLYQRILESKAKYGADQLMSEVEDKMLVLKRRLAADFYGDGTGVVGTVASVVDTTGAGGSTLVSLSVLSSARGHVGFFESGDLLLAKTAAGGAQATPPSVSGGTFYAWRLVDKSRASDQVTLEAVTSSGTVLSLTASNLAAGELFYRIGQETIPVTTSLATIGDFGNCSEVIPGLESLVSNDSRVIHGITMRGVSAGSVLDGQGAAIDTDMIHALMDDVKLKVGQGKYRWKMMAMSPEAHRALVSSRETDRRFNNIEDNKRGLNYFAFQHGDDTLAAYTSEYIPKKRLYALPEAKSGERVLEYHGTDFTPVKATNGDVFHLKPASGGGHERRVASYLQGMGTLICTRPGAIGKLINFVV